MIVATPPSEPSAIRVWMWRFIFAGHAVAALAWWWLMPGGFPWTDPHQWTNRVVPPVVALGAFFGWRGLMQRRTAPTSALAAAVVVLWTVMLVTACLLYPVSARRFGPPGAAATAALAAAWWLLAPTSERFARSQRWTWLVAAVLGVCLPWSIRSAPPTTHPLNVTPPDFTHIPGGDVELDALMRGRRVHLVPGDGRVVYEADDVMIEVQPLLTFESRSPDRCWTLYAPQADRLGPPRQFVGRRSIDDVALLRYLDDGAHTLRVRSRRESNLCEIEAFGSYPHDVYSHLNTFCQVTIHSPYDLRLAFSPCPETPIAVRSFDYPFGRPAQFAYLRDDGVFVIAEASSGEKGPFRTVAEGPLGRDAPLGVTVETSGDRLATIVFDDWAAQASTELSPTAGWGVPQNAVEFQRLEGGVDTTIAFWLTLAGTSVGRGFDSVGHKAGTYRNRLRIELPE